jgi:aspartate aminotransferase-like enzyme
MSNAKRKSLATRRRRRRDSGIVRVEVEVPAGDAGMLRDVAVLMGGAADPEALRAYCNRKCGVILGHGIGELSGKAIRIAHMGHVNAPMVLGTLGVIEVGLVALGIPHGKGGARAAIDWLGEQVKAQAGAPLRNG